MFVYPILHRLLHLNQTEGAEVRDIVGGLVGGLISHNLSLIDPSTRRPTSWGKWNIEWLNNVRAWSDNRGESPYLSCGLENVFGSPRACQPLDALSAI